MTNGYRQEVFNVLLAQLLQERGVIVAPESIIKAGPSRRMPDVLVTYRGLRTAIEGEIDDDAGAKERARESARGRVEEGIAHIGVAVVYPAYLRSETDFQRLAKQLGTGTLHMAIVTESECTGFIEGNVDTLESTLRHTFEHLVQEDVVARAVAALDAGIEQFAVVMAAKGGIVSRVADTLGIRELPQED